MGRLSGGCRATRISALVVAASLILPSAFATTPAAAAGPPIFRVTSTVDAIDAVPGDGLCLTALGACTLRAAVAEANASSTAGVAIEVPAGVYRLDGGQGGDSGDLDVTRTVRIVGAGRVPGAGATTIDGVSADRVFDVTGTDVVLDGLVVTKGSARTGAGIKVAAGASLTVANSSVIDNSASDQGAGIENSGTLTVTRSTLARNSATKKGGAVYNAGTATVVNSTLHANASAAGGGLVTTGTAHLVHVTVSANSSTNKLGGGVQRQGGTATIKASIIAENESNSADAKDCSGSPFLDGLNFIGNVSGCNPTGTQPLTGSPALGPLADNGGPTQTRGLLESSRARDGVVTATCLEAVDQRGVARPQGVGCDLGAFEVEPLGVDVTLTASEVEIGAGAAVVPMQALASAAAGGAGTTTASPLRSIPLRSIPLRSIPLRSIPLRSIPLRSIPLRSIAVATAPLRSISLGSLPLRSIPLRSILLSDVEVVGGWEAILAGTDFAGLPLQSLTLEDVAGLETVMALTLDDVDLASTRIGALSLVSLLLGTTPLRSIPLSGGGLPAGGTPLAAWCNLLGPDTCTALQITPERYNSFSLLTLELAGVSLGNIAWFSIDLATLDLGPTALGSIAVSALAPASRDAIVDCDPFDCTAATATLATAKAAGALRGTLADLVLGLVGDQDLPWEEIDLTRSGLPAIADPAEPGFTYTAGIDLRGGAAAAVDLTVTLPAGFVYEPGSATLDGVATSDPGADLGDPPVGPARLSFSFTAMTPGSHQLSLVARAGLQLGGPWKADAKARASAGTDVAESATATASINVREAFEEQGSPGDQRPLLDARLHVAHLSYSGDVDLYGFTVTGAQAARGESASIILSNLPADYDLVLYGPAAVRLRGAPTDERDMLPDHRLDLNPGDDPLTAEITADVPQTLPFPSGAVVHRASARRGEASERIDTGALREGQYWVQVSGANGANSLDPYALRIRRTSGIDRGACMPAPFAFSTPAPAALPTGLPSAADTIFLVNTQRLGAAFGTAGAADVLASVGRLAGRSDLGLVGAVVPVDAYDDVRGAYTAWDANRCSPAAANDVVREIGEVVDAVRADHPDVRNVVVVGDDVQIPMARVSDNTAVANERSFADAFAINNEMVAALAGGYVLTDNALATAAGVAVNDHEMFVPDLAVGRLVETPTEIVEVIESFERSNGLLDPSTALVSGYDFLADGANAVADALDGGTGLDGTLTRLISEGWSRADLVAALGAQRPGAIASINAHFDHNRALPAAGNASGDESDLFTTTDVSGVADALRGALLFSMGCHSGLSVSDVTVGSPMADWAQTFGGLGSSWVANTGFGYGDTELVALSEKLMARFAARIAAGDPVGAALSEAKRAYAADVALVSPYDEKVLHEAVLYGLPMLRVGDAAAGPSALTTLATELAADAGVETRIDPLTGLAAAGAAFDFSISADGSSSGAGVLTRRSTPKGDYYDVDGDVLTQAQRPVEPRTSIDVTHRDAAGARDDRARGVLVTGLTSIDQEISPLFFSPTIDLGANEPHSVAADASFPSKLAGIASNVGPDGAEDRLVVVPGQYRRTATAGTGTQRLFTGVDALVYYTDASAPMGPRVGVRRTTSQVDGNEARFEVETDHPAERVYLLFKPAGVTGSVAWSAVDLVAEPGTNHWFGSGTGNFNAGADGKVEYVVQVVSADGRVSWADDKADDFFGAPAGPLGDLSLVVEGPAPVAGWYPGAVTVTVTVDAPTLDGTVYSVDGAALAPYTGPFTISADGVHTVFVRDALGNTATTIISIDATGPSVAATTDPAVVAGSGGWHDGAVSVTLTGSDGGSGVASITYQVGSAATVTVAGASVAVPVGAEGSTAVVFHATDVAGNAGAAATLVVRVDRLAPVVICGTSDGLWHATNVSIACTASDAGSGLSDTASSSFSLATSVPSGSADANASTASRLVCDLVGRCATAGPIGGNKVDLASPTVTISTPPAGAVYAAGQVVAAVYSCADVGSGVASCTAEVGGRSVASGSTLPTTTRGSYTLRVTATDAVGHQSVVSRNYTVGYGICLLYDPAQPSLVGSTIPIKLQLCDSTGNVSSSSIEVRAVTIDGTMVPPPNFVGKTNLGNLFRFGSKSYIYNLDTSKLGPVGAGSHTMELEIAGVRASSYVARFTLRL